MTLNNGYPIYLQGTTEGAVACYRGRIMEHSGITVPCHRFLFNRTQIRGEISAPNTECPPIDSPPFHVHDSSCQKSPLLGLTRQLFLGNITRVIQPEDPPQGVSLNTFSTSIVLPTYGFSDGQTISLFGHVNVLFGLQL